jgi:hypothetical protein
MYNIILICTAHLENGKCNSDELFDILKEIKPEVIFDELTSEYSDMFYSELFETYSVNCILGNRKAPQVPLEVKSIKKYKQNYDVEIIPVDIDTRQKLAEYQNELNFIFHKLFTHKDYITFDEERETLIANEGFEYLNSDKFLDLSDKMDALENTIVASEIENERLLNIYNLFRIEQKEKRENAMLQNIYIYSQKNQYNQAVFLVGANHKKSIMQKIIDYEELSEIKLNWRMYGSKQK